MARIQLDITKMVGALDAERRAQNLSWRELARRTGVSPSTLTRMQQGKHPDVNTFLALVSWLKTPAERFIQGQKTGEPQKQTPSNETFDPLKNAEFPEEALEALNELAQAAYRFAKSLPSDLARTEAQQKSRKPGRWED